MPENKDLKRLARRRMQKTGESYTTARARLLAKNQESTPAPERYAEIADMSDDAVRAKTGRTWEGWVRQLDAIDAIVMSHKEIARHVTESYEVSGWWAQTVTVGYERIKGLREIGQRRAGTYDANKSKTLPVPLRELYRAFSDTRTRKRWLPDVEPTLRKATPDKSIRMTWEDGTTVQAYFTAKGEAKSQVAIQHGKLATKADAERAKAFWAERLTALHELLVGSP